MSCASAPRVKPFALQPLKVEKGSPEKSFWQGTPANNLTVTRETVSQSLSVILSAKGGCLYN